MAGKEALNIKSIKPLDVKNDHWCTKRKSVNLFDEADRLLRD